MKVNGKESTPEELERLVLDYMNGRAPEPVIEATPEEFQMLIGRANAQMRSVMARFSH
jgi:hypothetical protein